MVLRRLRPEDDADVVAAQLNKRGCGTESAEQRVATVASDKKRKRYDTTQANVAKSARHALDRVSEAL